jgi:hypothetical protein
VIDAGDIGWTPGVDREINSAKALIRLDIKKDPPSTGIKLLNVEEGKETWLTSPIRNLGYHVKFRDTFAAGGASAVRNV